MEDSVFFAKGLFSGLTPWFKIADAHPFGSALVCVLIVAVMAALINDSSTVKAVAKYCRRFIT